MSSSSFLVFFVVDVAAFCLVFGAISAGDWDIVVPGVVPMCVPCLRDARNNSKKKQPGEMIVHLKNQYTQVCIEIS
jgi:hypothetical protein